MHALKSSLVSRRSSLVVFCLLFSVICLLSGGCATTKMEVTKYGLDGNPTIAYKAEANTAFQDFKGSNLIAKLNPEGETSVEAGSIDNVTNAAIVEALGKIAALLEKLTPLLIVAP